MKHAEARVFDHDLDVLFATLARESQVLVAVSGGSDSLALLYLLHQWSARRDRPRVSVATIDHGLRKEASAEARQVAEFCRKIGISHVTMVWSGAKPESGLSQKAREARYELLARAAFEAGAGAIILGHTMDDQRETVLMRAARLGLNRFDPIGDVNENRGLAGMRPSTTYKGPPFYRPIKLVRPMLGISRDELRSLLREAGIDWIEDPSNQNEAYERIRMRKELIANSEKYPALMELSGFSDRVAKRREKLAGDCARFIHESVKYHPPGIAEIDRGALLRVSRELATLLARVMIGVAGGQNYLVSPLSAVDLVAQIRNGGLKKTTLGAALIEQRGDTIYISRENRNLPVLIIGRKASRIIMWDGRVVYRFSDEMLDQERVMTALGVEGLHTVETATGRRLQARQRSALLTQPTVFFNGKAAFLPFMPEALAGKQPDFAVPAVEFWSPSLELFQLDCDRKLLISIDNLRRLSLRKPLAIKP